MLILTLPALPTRTVLLPSESCTLRRVSRPVGPEGLPQVVDDCLMLPSVELFFKAESVRRPDPKLFEFSKTYVFIA